MSLLEVGTMKAVLIAVGVGFVVLYAGLCMYLYLMQRSFIYFPTPPSRGVAAEELAIESEGATLQVWRLHGDRPDAILYFGGNAEDVAGNVAEFREWFPRHAIYLVNYRGYGGSSGTPTEAGLYRDAEAVFDVARAQHGRIAVIGRSLGAGVATHLASVRPLDRVALVSPPASIAALAQSIYPFMPTQWLLRDRFDSLARAKRIEAPVLMLIAEHDRTIPPEHSQQLASAIDGPTVEVQTIEAVDHNSIGMSPAYGAALRTFLGAAQDPLRPRG